ncbi:hypothetical protein QR680_006435 [Steinernema hermaphroditum]|uniref:Uncharacterized protein n=1 Tax=Steinernema hermaphroditum TaxID=289476 RepID=A0AA39HXM9_9BILA|nr:hypothetical protein QR680_006435 [Steinernema hermaphroditum]
MRTRDNSSVSSAIGMFSPFKTPGWVTDDLLNRCILKNADLLALSNSSPSFDASGLNRTLQQIKRPTSYQSAFTLEAVTGIPFIAARNRPPDDEDTLWEARLNPTDHLDDGISTETQERPDIPSLACHIVAGFVDAKLATEDSPEDLEFINRQLLEEQLDDADEVDPNEIRDLIEETRRQEGAAVLFENRYKYIVDPRRRVLNPYLLDQNGERLKLPPSEQSAETSARDIMQLSTDGSSVLYRCGILNELRRMNEHRDTDFQEYDDPTTEGEDTFEDGCIDICSDDSLIYASGDPDSETEQSIPTEQSSEVRGIIEDGVSIEDKDYFGQLNKYHQRSHGSYAGAHLVQLGKPPVFIRKSGVQNGNEEKVTQAIGTKRRIIGTLVVIDSNSARSL